MPAATGVRGWIPDARSMSQAGQWRRGARRIRMGIESTVAAAASPPTIGMPALSKPDGATGARTMSSAPAPTSAATLTALVRKNNALERSMIALVDIPARRSNHPPIASAPTPPPGSSAPEPCSVNASSRAAPAGTSSKYSRKITTNAMHDANSSATAASIQSGRRCAISVATPRSGGTREAVTRWRRSGSPAPGAGGRSGRRWAVPFEVEVAVEGHRVFGA